MIAKRNNPRVFAETISLDAWRSRFDGERGEADLHVDVVFAPRGRVGGADAPVRFRLSLKRAEVHVLRDGEGIINLKRSSILRPSAIKSTETLSQEQKAQYGGDVELGLEVTNLAAKVGLKSKAQASSAMSITKRIESQSEVGPMKVTHWSTESGYAFRIEARHGSRLDGQPWSPGEPLMRIVDTKHQRKRGESPEIRIELHCRREDLLIEDIEFTSSKFPLWRDITRNKQILVEQYLKAVISENGLDCGDLDEPFARLILGDAVPSIE